MTPGRIDWQGRETRHNRRLHPASHAEPPARRGCNETVGAGFLSPLCHRPALSFPICLGYFLLAPFIDQRGYQCGPPGLMGGAQTFAGLCIKIFAERYVVPPMRVALELFDISEYRTPSVRSPGKYRNQRIRKIPRHL